MFPTLFAGMALVAGAPALKDPPAKPPSVEGEWTVVSSLAGGKPDELVEKNRPDKIVIESEKWVVIRRGEVAYETGLTLDAKQDPPHMDLSQPGQVRGTRAIYRLEGDTLVICYTIGGERPTAIECPPNSNVRMVTMKRLKK